MGYKLTTVERDEDGETYRTPRPWATRGSLNSLLAVATRYGWLPGARSETGLTIIETIIEST